MFKRIKDRFSQDTNRLEKLNEYGYVPTHEEIETEISYKKLEQMKRKYDF